MLSGGLGNSVYVQTRLRERYSFGNTSFPNARSLQVRVAPEPQLVVCKGIVADRVQKLKTGKSVLGWRCSRASYGTLCKVPYNPQNPLHFSQPTRKDPLDGKLYITDCISWFIKQVSKLKIHQLFIGHWKLIGLGRTRVDRLSNCQAFHPKVHSPKSHESKPRS